MVYEKYDPSQTSQSLSFPPVGFMEKATAELSRAIYQLIEVYCSSFSTDFQPGHPPGGASSNHAGLHSHLNFTVCSLHNVPETWAHGWAAENFHNCLLSAISFILTWRSKSARKCWEINWWRFIFHFKITWYKLDFPFHHITIMAAGSDSCEI